MRRIAPLLPLVLALPAPASAAVRLGSDADVVALAGAGPSAVALLDAGRLDGPVRAVRSSGRGVNPAGVFGDASAEFHAVAGDASGRIVLGWDRSISNGVQYVLKALDGPGARAVAVGTGPQRLAIGRDGSAVIAHADEAGDVAVTTIPDVARPRRGEPDPYALPRTDALTDNGPRFRHYPVALALRDDGPLVLDLMQRRGRSELRMVGRGAPPAAITAVRKLRHLQGAMVASESRVAVAYISGGRPILATARPGGAWRRRTLPGRAVQDAPGIAFSGSRVVVAWSQSGEIRAATVGSRVSRRRVTRSRGSDENPLVAGASGGRVYVGWTREVGSRRTPLLQRLR